MSERGVACRRRTGEDMISLLPDHLLCQILSDVPTKTAVVTSVLSTRWRTIWLSTPVLDLHTHDFPNVTAFASFITWFLELSKGSSCLHKLKLALVSERPIQDISSESSSWDLAFVRGHLDPYYFMTQWIDNAVTRKVKHLDILYPWIFGMMPLSIYTCVTLVSLKIQNVSLADTENVSLPRLKTMHLENNIYATDALLEKLVSCPVLEDLTVVRKGDTVYDFEVLRVRSQSLKSLVVVLIGREWWYKACRVAVIDAPGLKYLSLKDSKFTSYVISSLSSSAKVDIDVSFDVDNDLATDRSVVRSFFTMLSSVRNMIISQTTSEVYIYYIMCINGLIQ
ncbi:putative F-box/FBD/LRR-repeat protein At5g22670 [Brassica napus]|uniref:putative F-box/FBD/LRR-repeat protein At5g22670 n=1 Tax=Brassica napus TaxID=3708 RepID=UPI002079649A|nr:putative F-box/FBD/LRR-repeat protein At5g22670 [Brassica napus]